MIKINKKTVNNIKFDSTLNNFKYASFFNNNEKMVYNAEKDSFYKQNPELIEYDEEDNAIIHYDVIKIFNHDDIKKIIFNKHKEISKIIKKENKIKKIKENKIKKIISTFKKELLKEIKNKKEDDRVESAQNFIFNNYNKYNSYYNALNEYYNLVSFNMRKSSAAKHVIYNLMYSTIINIRISEEY